MSDGSGRINLHGPAIDDYYPYDSAFTIYGDDGWYYKFNPCNGFYMGYYYDLAVSRPILRKSTFVYFSLRIFLLHLLRLIDSYCVRSPFGYPNRGRYSG